MKKQLLLSPLFALSALVLTSACSDIEAPDWFAKKEAGPKIAGERLAVLPKDQRIAADASLAGESPAIPEAMTIEAWPQHYGNAQSYVGHPHLADDITVRDSVTIGDGEGFGQGLVPTPVVGNSRVFAMDAMGAISAHDAADISRIIWQNNGVANAQEETMLAGGLALEGGTLFAVSGNGLVAAFDAASGRELWRQSIHIPVRAAPSVAGGRVYVITIDSQLFSINAKMGSVVWSDRGVSEGASFLASASATVAGGLVAAPFSSGEIRVLDAASGQPIWSDGLVALRRSSATEIFTGMGGDPVITGNAMIAASASGVVAAYRLDNGLRVWEQPIASAQTPWVAGQAVFVLSMEGQLVALSRQDGRVFWAADVPRYENEDAQLDAIKSSGPVLAGGWLYVVSSNGQLRAFSPESGSLIRDIDIPGGVFSPPIIAGEKMYLVTQDAKLVVLY